MINIIINLNEQVIDSTVVFIKHYNTNKLPKQIIYISVNSLFILFRLFL